MVRDRDQRGTSVVVPPTITVAAVNMNVLHDRRANLAKLEAFIEEAAASGAKLVVFPEQALQGCVWSLSHELTSEEWLSHRNAAEPIPGPITDWLAERAARHNTVIVLGMTERRTVRGREVLHNACPVVGPQGLIGVYRKVHLVGDEVHVFRPGDRWPVFETPIGTVGVLICYDSEFPEAARSLALGGAQILVMPAAWPMLGDGGPDDPGGELYELLTRVRAQENQIWLIVADQVGRSDVGDVRFYGHSRVVAPTGRVLAELSLKEGVVSIPIDVTGGLRDGMLRTLPPGLDYLQDRRPHTYGRLCAGSQAKASNSLPGTEPAQRPCEVIDLSRAPA